MGTKNIAETLIIALKALLTGAATYNREQRDEVRKVVGEVADALTSAMDMAIVYLNNARYARPDEIAPHLARARSALNTTYREFQICGALYNLSDRFERVFDGVKATVHAGRAHEIHYLLRDLAGGEKCILDYMDDSFQWAHESASRLHAMKLGTPDWEAQRSDILKSIDGRVQALEKQRDDLRREARHLLSRM